MAKENSVEFELKTLSKESIDAAFEKVELYRLLNEPRSAESICRDILEVEPENQSALVSLLLSLTDQFQMSSQNKLEEARSLVSRLTEEHDRAYYSGVICERQGKAVLHRQQLGGGQVAYGWLRDAMGLYEKAEGLSKPGNDSARLRWNTCARIIMEDESIRPEHGGDAHPSLE